MEEHGRLNGDEQQNADALQSEAEPLHTTPPAEPDGDAARVKRLVEQMGDKHEIHVHFDKIFSDHATYTENSVRAGTISGSRIQGAGDRAVSRQSTVKPPESEREFEDYLERYQNSPVSCAILAVATLGTVSEARLDQLTGRLRQALYPDCERQQREGGEEISRFPSLGRLIETAYLERCTIVRTSRAGQILIRCLRLESPALGERIRGWLWDLYPQFRVPLFQWLQALAEDSEAFLAQTAREAMAVYAEMDFGDTCERLLPLLTAQPDLTAIACLSEITQRLFHSEAYRENIDLLLGQWLRMRNGSLWMVGVRLYAWDEEGSYERRIPAALRLVLTQAPSEELTLRNTACYLLGLAQRSRRLLAALADALYSLYQAGDHHRDRETAVQVFLQLLEADYLMTDRDSSQLQLVRCLTSTQLRPKLLPVLALAWGHARSREVCERVLRLHIVEYITGGGSADGLKPLFRALAFTGAEEGLLAAVHFLRSLLSDRRREVADAARLLAGDLKTWQERTKEPTRL